MMDRVPASLRPKSPPNLFVGIDLNLPAVRPDPISEAKLQAERDADIAENGKRRLGSSFCRSVKDRRGFKKRAKHSR